MFFYAEKPSWEAWSKASFSICQAKDYRHMFTSLFLPPDAETNKGKEHCFWQLQSSWNLAACKELPPDCRWWQETDRRASQHRHGFVFCNGTLIVLLPKVRMNLCFTGRDTWDNRLGLPFHTGTSAQGQPAHCNQFSKEYVAGLHKQKIEERFPDKGFVWEN